MLDIYHFFITVDVCTCIFCIFLLLMIYSRENLHIRKARLFSLLVLFMLAASFSELFVIAAPETSPLTFSAAFSRLLRLTCPSVFLLYLLELAGELRAMRTRQKVLLSIPEIFLFGSVIFQTIHQQRISALGWAGRFIVGFYCACLFFFLQKHHDSFQKKDYHGLLTLTIGMTVGAVSGRHLLILQMAIVFQILSCLYCFFTIEDDSRFRDTETGLLSRYALLRFVRPFYDASYHTWIIALDIRNSSYYQMTLGSTVMAGILHEMGSWLHGFSRDGLRCFRSEQGQFIIVMQAETRENAEAFAEKIRKKFEGTWIYETAIVAVTASVRMACIPDQIRDEKQLLLFMSTIAQQVIGSDNPVMFTDVLKQQERQLEVEQALQRGISRKSFRVYYQPIYDARTGRFRSAEALVRLHDEKLGSISPEEFIRVAEQTGLIHSIGEMVFEEVCRFLSESDVLERGIRFIEVNLSTVQCMDDHLAETFRAILDRYHVDPHRINLEITESAVIFNESVMVNSIRKLQQEGFSFSLDDFGTGNASYSYIAKYPFRLIKIDKSFLWESEKDPVRNVIFLNMLSLIRGLERRSVAEGVETEKQKQMLIQRGTDYLQGYYFSKPLPEDQFLEYLGAGNF